MPSDGADRSPRSGRGLLAVLIVAGIVVLDQATKIWAVERLADGPIAVVGDDIGFRLSRNSGGAFSVLQGFTPVLALLAVVLIVVLVRAVSRVEDWVMLVGLSLVLGGVLGNLVDRLVRSPGFLRGEVVDFLGVGSFPTFNVADSAITIGAVCVVAALVFAPTDGPPAGPPAGSPEVPNGTGSEA